MEGLWEDTKVILEENSRSPIVNKMLIEVNLEQMPGLTGSQEDLHDSIRSASTINQQG